MSPDPLALLRDLVDALPRCEGLAWRAGHCRSVATREIENAPGWTPVCDDPEHLPPDSVAHGRPVRSLHYADPLRAALAALALKDPDR